jgi:phosphatidylinositol-3-phosphatase
MRRRLTALLAAMLTALGVTVSVSAGASPAAAAAPCGTTTTAPTYQHVIWIWMENHSYSAIIGNTAQAPYINSLAGQCGLATNYHNVSHPSLPNYIAGTSGLAVSSLSPFTSDCSPSKRCSTSAPSIFGQGESWKAYEESMPSNCDKSTLPAFSFITPNLIDDMHDGTTAQGDSWLSANVPNILNSSEYTSGTTALFITWDEGTGGSSGENCATNTTDASCHVATLVISPSTAAGSTPGTLFNHYSLLGTTEQLLGLPALGQAGSTATTTSAFNL